MSFLVFYHEDVVKKDIPRLSSTVRKNIQKAIQEKLTTHPEYFGKPLRRSLKGYRKLRVSDWRVIFRIEQNKIKVFAICHRSIVYERIPGRFDH